MQTGYYSHQSCFTESKTMGGNERRRAVKKIAVGAAIVGAIAAGAGKLIDISSQSKGSNSPAAQTILTSQGLIPPALTSDPANPVPGQMWYRSDAGVEAHFDGVQNRVVYSSEINDGNVNVTSKGIINGLSVLPNDGKGGFGPDTTKGATAPGQYGSPYTETVGNQEALTYLESTGGSLVLIDPVTYFISEPLTYSSNYGLTLKGNALSSYDVSTPGIPTFGSIIAPTSSFPSGDYLFTVGTDVQNIGQVSIYDLEFFGSYNYADGAIANGISNSYILAGYPMPTMTIRNVKTVMCTTGINFNNSNFNGAGTITVDSVTLEDCTQWGMYVAGAFTLYVNNATVFACGTAYSTTNPAGGMRFGDISVSTNQLQVTASNLIFEGTDGIDIYTDASRVTISNLNIYTYNESAYIMLNKSTAVTVSSYNILNNASLPIAVLVQSGAALVISGGYQALNGDITEFVSFESTWTYGLCLITGFGTTLNGYTLGSPSIPPAGDNDVVLISDCLNFPTTAPTISTNPPVSGTTYQNTNPFNIRLRIPVTYSPTSTAAATLATGTSSTSTVTTSTKVSYPAGITTGIIDTYEIVVKAGQYFELVVTNATIGTVEVQAA